MRRAVAIAVIPTALVLAACGSSVGQTDSTERGAGSPSVSVQSATPSDAAAMKSAPSSSSTVSESQSSNLATNLAAYSVRDKEAFLQAIQDETDDLWKNESDEDLVSLADSLISVHSSGATWKQVMKILTDNLPESDAKIYGELVVRYLMKNLGEDDAWKVAADKQREAREASAAADQQSESEPAKPGPTLTAGQEQALGKAEDYLRYSHFSKKSLIEQLKYEGFSRKDAAFAVDSVHVSWKNQAAEKAKEYLQSSHFSRSGLIEQLKYEGFTQSQAEFGAKKAGL